MSASLMIFVTCCYLGVTISELSNGNTWLAITFAGYSLANVGFIMVMLR
jgi:hypothetical protein